VKQQFTGSYTLDVASRTIVLSGIEIPPERLAVVINSSVGFVYHNIEHEPTASVTASGGVTTIVFPAYKDCETHQNSDSLSIFYDDGVDLGKLIKDESDETQTLLTEFKKEVKAESDETQTLLQTEFDATQTILTDFKTEAKAESDETQTLFQTEFDATQTLLTEFKTEVKDESDATQTLLQTEFDATQTLLTEFKTEVKAEFDATQTLLQTEFDATQTLLTNFKTEVKEEFDELQALLEGKLPDFVVGMVPTEFLSLFQPTTDVDVDFVPGGYGPSRIIFSRAGVFLKALNLYYGTSGDSLGKIVLITSGLWSPLDLPSASRTVWLDASDPSTVFQSSGVVDSWADKWAGGFEFKTTTNSEKPTTGVAQINGLETITFDGTNDVLYSRKNGALRSLTDLDKDVAYNNWAGFFVVRSKSLKNTAWYNEVAASHYIGVFPYSNNWFYFDAGFDTSGAINRAAYTPFTGAYPTTSLIGLTANTAGSTKSYLNGEIKHQTSSPFSLTAGVWTRLGGNGTLTDGSDADWGEVIILRQVPDEPTRQKIEGYLAHKWGLTGNLAASHPYKFAPPGI